MAVQETERPRVKQVLNDIFTSYASSTPYDLVSEPPPTGVSLNAFAYDRRDKILPLIASSEWTSPRKERDSFMSEWIVMLGLKKLLGQSGLSVELAPPHLEIGANGRRGVDLIASKELPEDGRYLPIFAINVKLQHPRKGRRVEYYKYDNILGCPAIELSLGDFSIQTKRSGEVSIVPWLRQVAAPNITNSGHIPDFYEWQNYLVRKVEKTISHYMVKTDDFLHGDYRPSEQESNLFPDSEKEFYRFYENLTSAYLFFKELSEADKRS